MDTSRLAYAEPVGQRLSGEDVKRLQQFAKDFVNVGLAPLLRQQVESLSTAVAAGRKGRMNLFSATRKWFGSGKTPPNSPGDGARATGTAYGSTSTEMLTRRLADLTFILQSYDVAYTHYHSAKKDFSNDKVWKHLAGAQEMQGVCLFMQDTMDSARTDYYRHFESAILTYLSKCNSSLYATRATLFASEMLLAKGQMRDAANAFVRMAGDESDLRSAVLLEQAASCFFGMQPALHRRAAFHLVLAASRYGKAGQRQHALHCSLRALCIYKGRDWRLAEDHIRCNVAHHCLQLGLRRRALQALLDVLRPASEQTATQQRAYFREFVACHRGLYSRRRASISSRKARSSRGDDDADLSKGEGDGDEGSPAIAKAVVASSAGPRPLGPVDQARLELPVPRIDQNALTVRFQPQNVANASRLELQDPDNTSTAPRRGGGGGGLLGGKRAARLQEGSWDPLEQAASRRFKAGLVLLPEVLDASTDNNRRPVCVVGEPIFVQFTVANNLRIPLQLNDVQLMCHFEDEETAEEDSKEGKEEGDAAPEAASSDRLHAALSKNQAEDKSLVEATGLVEVALEPDQELPVALSLTPLKPGRLRITGLR